MKINTPQLKQARSMLISKAARNTIEMGGETWKHLDAVAVEARYLPSNTYGYQMWVVYNGSTDGQITWMIGQVNSEVKRRQYTEEVLSR